MPKHQNQNSGSVSTAEPSNTEVTDHSPVVEAIADDKPKQAVAKPHEQTLQGLAWLSQPGANGILILLPVEQSQLSTDARQLMIKMIQAIGVKANDCGYLSTGNEAANVALEVSTINGIIAFGKSAGDHLVQFCNARRVPGEHTFQLERKPMIVTLHPDELLDTPELKRQAWNDLKHFARMLNEPDAGE